MELRTMKRDVHVEKLGACRTWICDVGDEFAILVGRALKEPIENKRSDFGIHPVTLRPILELEGMKWEEPKRRELKSVRPRQRGEAPREEP